MKTTKRALFSSVIALILCFSMLVGTTFAWFTDEVKSGVNQIVAGNLDIELYNSLTVGTDKVTEETKLFEEITYWEPGVVAYENLTVANLGTLALKYQLSVNFTDASTNAKGETLAKVLKVGFVKGGINTTDREAALAMVKTWLPLESFVQEGTLAGVAEDVIDNNVYGIVIYWAPSDIDNEFNMNNENRGKVMSINLGVKLFATQLAAEDDSFDNKYDEDAIYYDALVKKDAELLAAIQDPQVKVIAIDENVTYNWGGDSYANSKALLMAGKTFYGVDGNETITFAGYGSANPIVDVTLKDITVKDTTVGDNEAAWEHGHLEFESLTANNVVFADSIMLNGDCTLTNCSMNNQIESWYGLWIEGGNTVIRNCSFTGTRAIKVHEANGSEVGYVVIDNNEFVSLSEKPGVAIGNVNAATSITLTNNLFAGTQEGDQKNYKYESDTDVANFNFTDENNKVFAQDSSLPQGLYKVDENTWLASNANALSQAIAKAEDGQTVVLAQDVIYTGNGYANIVKNITLDLNGNTLSTTSAGVVAKAGTIKNGTVSNPAGGRAALRTWSGVSIENVVVESPANGGITVASGNSLPYIKNVTINAKTYGIELQYGASVDTIENVNIVAGGHGIVVQGGTIGNISNVVIDAKNAGIYGQLKGTTDLKITVDGTNEIVGGNYGLYLCDEGTDIVPDGSAYLTYDDASVFSGSVKDMEFAFGQSGKLYINGAKVGAFISTAEELFAFAKAVNEEGKTFSGQTVFLTADIDLDNAVWTPIGQTGATQFQGTFDGHGYTIKNLNIDTSKQTGANYSTGLFGWLNNATVKNLTIENATVTGNHNVGVIAGYMETAGCTISNCHVINATVVAKHANDDACGDKVGVIVGHAGNAGVKVENCSATNSTVTAGRDAGQIAGAALTANVIGCSAENVSVTAGSGCTGANIRNELIGRVL